jgi:flagellar basal body-associated protein FliL
LLDTSNDYSVLTDNNEPAKEKETSMNIALTVGITAGLITATIAVAIFLFKLRSNKSSPISFETANDAQNNRDA